MGHPDDALRHLIEAIATSDSHSFSQPLARMPQLARASFVVGAARNFEEGFFIEPVSRWIVAGDTALHFAAAAYSADAVKALLAAGADVGARNRHGHTPLHAAAAGNPSSPQWNPSAQASTIAALVQAGADPNIIDKRGVTPLHIAVRTRSAGAVRALIELGADPTRTNGAGSTPILLATQNTGRGGSGSPEAKAQQQEIIQLLRAAQTPVNS